jgi:hypothetical protein
MTKKPLRRAMTTLLVLAMMLVGTAVPALAVAQGSATITQGADLVSGVDGQDVVFNVSNTGQNSGLPLLGSTATSIDLVQVVPPEGLFDDGAYSLGDFRGPSGWTPFLQNNIIRFRADEGAEIAPGDSAEFKLRFDVLPQPADEADNFFVSVSDNDGRLLTTAGVPEVVVRTLEVVLDSINILKPAIADNQSGLLVTEQQDNAKAAVTIRNRGVAAQDVTPVIERASGSSSVQAGTAPTGSVAAGGTRTFEVPVTFGSPGDLVLKANATSDQGSRAPELVDGDTITVQERIRLSYVGDSLTPRGINPTSNPSPSFGIQLNKTGGPATNAGALDLTFNVDGLSTTRSVSIGSGNVNNVPVTFDPLNVTSLADDTYSTTLDFEGIDANGATIVPNNLTLQQILIDRIAALVNITLTPPASAVDYPDIVDAASFDDAVQVGGSVERGGSGCGDCTVTDAVARVNGRAIPGAEVSVSVGANGGISGTVTMPGGSPEQVGQQVDGFTYQAGDNQLTLSLTVGRTVNGIESPNAGTGSAQAPVDIVRPTLLPPSNDFPRTGTVTGRDANGDYVDILFSEPVAFGTFSSPATHWLVDGATVTSVQFPGEENSASGTDRVRLRLLEELDNNAEPVATYNPRGLLASTGFDRVELEFSTPAVVEVADGIAPDVLDLLTLSTYREGRADNNANRVDLGPVNGNFVTRDTSPVLVVADVLPSDRVQVFADTNGNGVQDPGEPNLGSATNNGTDARDLEIQLSLSGSEPLNLGAYAIDSNGNRGVSLTGFTITLDRTNITIADFAVSGNDITVTMSEAITTLDGYQGRDAAIDWFVYADGRWRPVNEVANSGGAETRILSVDSAVVPDTSAITRVRYEFVNFGEASNQEERYLDRALNTMIDGFFEKTG